MYISGTHDVRWNNDVLNPAFSGLTASDFEVVQFGWVPPVAAPTFTDDPLAAGITRVKALHVQELRTRIGELRARYGLGAPAWTDPSLVSGSTPIKAAHLTELRAALAEVYAAAGRPSPAWGAPTITGGATIISASHIAELRSAIRAIW
jgi:hypothetical protein